MLICICRQPVGSSPMEVRAASPRLWRVVFHCKRLHPNKIFTPDLFAALRRICWPIEGDQVVTSVHASVNLGVGFELIEVRSGDGLKPIHRLGGRAPKGTRAAMAAEIREVLDSARGEAGAQMRTRAEEMRNELKDSWVEGGIARTELQAFVAKFK